MERIQYYPPGESLKGKNHIFFAAHPEDKEQYFDALWKDITGIENNCVFLFDAQPELPWDDALTDILTQTGIQMFLFPVTAKLLLSENNAVAALLPYAFQNNASVLPVLLESGLEEQYAHVFGDRQYMDKVTVDYTAIPYEEKLKSHLRNTLVSKETVEKIQARFVAYIFLSYRKKDRALASKLMRLIHEIPQMRDVAIWYDEFLVPGEDFNDNIAKALAKSALFTLAVTPNLLEEGNYVLKHEYPNARDAGKPILPVQVADTDPVAFQSCFEALSGSIDAYNGKALETALLDAFGKLRNITLAQNNDSLHTYLIGLAYLYGIDVEVDHKRALALITDAAEKDCPEAMAEIISMYCNGIGVARNIHEGIRWFNRLINYHQNRVTSEAEAVTVINLFCNLAEAHRMLCAYTDAKQAYLLALEHLTAYQNLISDTERQRRRLIIYSCLTSVCNEIPESCVAYCDEGIAICNELLEKKEDPDIRKQIARFYFDKSIYYSNQEAYAESFAWAEKSMAHFQQIGEAQESVRDTRFIINCLTSLGELAGKLVGKDSFSSAERYLQQAISKQENLITCTDHVDDWNRLANCWGILGTVYREHNCMKEARNAHMQCIRYAEQICRDVPLPKYRLVLNRAYHNLAIMMAEQGEYSEAESWFQKALGTHDPLTNMLDPDLRAREDSHTCMELGLLSLKKNEWEKAQIWFQKAERALRRDTVFQQSTEWSLLMAELKVKIGEHCIDWYQRYCHASFQQNAPLDAMRIKYNSTDVPAMVTAKAALHTALELLGRPSAQENAHRTRLLLMKCNFHLSKLYQLCKNIPAARKYAYRALAEEDVCNESCKLLHMYARACTQYASVCEPAEKETWYQKAHFSWNTLASRTNLSSDWFFFAESLYYAGMEMGRKYYVKKAQQILAKCAPSLDVERFRGVIQIALKK